MALLGRKLLGINLLIAAGLSVLYICISPVIGSFFNNDTAVIAAFDMTFWIIILAQPLNSIAFSFDGIFKGLGEAVYLRNTLVIGSLIIFIPVLLILDYFDMGIMAIWYALLAWMLFRGATLVWKFRKLTQTDQLAA